MPEQKLDLILRGLHLVIRMSCAPSDPVVQAKHYAGLQRDIGPWLQDYATIFGPEKPLTDS